MTDLEKLYTSRINAIHQSKQARYDEALRIAEKEEKVARKFLEQISFLNNYGFNWHVAKIKDDNNQYGWIVYLLNQTMMTSPFEQIIVKEFNGEVKGKWMPCRLGKGRYVKGADNEGWFTPEQLIKAFS